MFSPISIREFFKFPSTNSLASTEPMISFSGTMGSGAGISSIVSGKYSRTPAGDIWLIAENVSVLFPLIMQSHDLSSSLTRISVILFGGSEFVVGKLSALHPLNRTAMDAVRIINRICLVIRVSFGVIVLNLCGFKFQDLAVLSTEFDYHIFGGFFVLFNQYHSLAGKTTIIPEI